MNQALRSPMQEKLVFDHTLEAMFQRALGALVTPALKEKLRKEGLDLDRKLLPAYPFETWARCLDITAQILHPHLPQAKSLRLLGEQLVEGYRQTFVGSAVLGVLRVLGPRRMLRRTQQHFRSGNNYTEVRLT